MLGKYLEKQEEIRGKKDLWDSFYKTSRMYRDYIEECQTLELDLNDKQVLFPKNLKQAHERTMAQIKFEKTKQIRKNSRKLLKKWNGIHGNGKGC